MRVDYHVHVAAHGEYSYSRLWIEQYLERALQRGIKEIGFSEHDEFSHLVDWGIVQQLQAENWQGINIRLGVEVDYIPGREATIDHIVQQADYDYVIGSVHFIEGWGFDHPDFRTGFSERDVDEVYLQYAALMLKMVQIRAIDIVGHLDLVKIWGHRPAKHPSLHYFEPVLQAIRRRSLAVEINSAGLRKEVAELYPAPDIIEMMYNYNIPIIMGSDAHHPEQTGEGLEAAYRAAYRAGYRYLVRFNRRQQLKTPLEY